MGYKIVVDSCCELPKELKEDSRFEIVPLGLEVGEYNILDDENFNQKEFLAKVSAYSGCPKSSCPSPERFMEAYGADVTNIFVVTLSAKLSGSHNSAELGRHLYMEKNEDKNIFVCDSESASCGETQIALKAVELMEANVPFEEAVEALTQFRDELRTYFVLDNLETLRKNGRLTGVKAFVASTLSIKPIMGATEGDIIQKGQAIGIKKALTKMVDIIVKEVKEPEKKILRITHCNCPERAELVLAMIKEKIKVKDSTILESAGISSMYANDGGVIVTI